MASGYRAAAEAAVDLSAGLAAATACAARRRPRVLREVCRLDLTPGGHSRAGSAAATLIAQVRDYHRVPAAGLLLLTPATTARHFREWLVATARPFGLANPRAVDAGECLGG